jgi:formate dehydrogenase major subunit
MALVDVRPTQARVQSLKTAGVKEIPSVCPYCAVGCGLLVGVKDGKIMNIEGNPDSPINRGTLCPKGAASFQLAVNPLRSTRRCIAGQEAPTGKRSPWTRRWT